MSYLNNNRPCELAIDMSIASQVSSLADLRLPQQLPSLHSSPLLYPLYHLLLFYLQHGFNE